MSQTVFRFSDGACWLLYDSRNTYAQNMRLHDLIEREGRRRLKAGGSDAGTIRARRESDVEVKNDVPIGVLPEARAS